MSDIVIAEDSLAASRSPEIKKLLATMEKKLAVTTSLEETKAFLDLMCSQIMRIKQIKADLHRQFVQSMTICLRQIWGYKQLRIEVERLR